MDVERPVLEHLSPDECIRLMASVPVGRIVYTRQALPAVELVNFALHDGDIVIKTDAGDKLAAATIGAVVAFEADNVDAEGHAGWSVTVVGKSRAVTDSDEIRDLEQIALTPWAPGKRDHYIRISPSIVHGRRISSQDSSQDISQQARLGASPPTGRPRRDRAHSGARRAGSRQSRNLRQAHRACR